MDTIPIYSFNANFNNRFLLQQGLTTPLRVQRAEHVTVDLVRRLGLEKELEGHSGCVNCLEWNERGSHLASGSDDCNVILWNPFEHKKLCTMRTQHTGNIFSVKFLSGINDSLIVTGAADFCIRVHDLDRFETQHEFKCHTGRVKRLATSVNQPYLFWSAAEDGTVRQFDLRDPAFSQSKNAANVLVNIKPFMVDYGEAKCLAINPQRSELLAVGCNDPYIRIFDRRKLSLKKDTAPANHLDVELRRMDCSDDDKTTGPEHDSDVTYYAPGHFQYNVQARRRLRQINVTYLNFSPNGQELVANLGGEQVYLFSVFGERAPFKFEMPHGLQPDSLQKTLKSAHQGNGITIEGGINGVSGKMRKRSRYDSSCLPRRIEYMKETANEHYKKEEYSLAIDIYNEAICLAPNFPVLYCNRAAAYLKRKWDGDLYAALLDCQNTVKLDPNYMKAHYRFIQCLNEISLHEEAHQYFQLFKLKFSDQEKTSAYQDLETNISAKLREKNANQKKAKNEFDGARSKSGPDGARAKNGSDGVRSKNNSFILLSNNSSNDSSPSSPKSEASPGGDKSNGPSLSALQEERRRHSAKDYMKRFCGHCNTTTDIKEANFFGSDGQFIMAGSDDGSFFIWDRHTTNIVRVLHGDDSIVNCLQPHPSCCFLASSGIDHVVRLWSPMSEDYKEEREISDREKAASANQRRMNADPLEIMLMNMGYRLAPRSFSEPRSNSDDADEDASEGDLPCRTS